MSRVRVHAVIRDRRAVIERIGVIGDRPSRPHRPDAEGPRGGANPNGIPQLGVDPTGRELEGARGARPEPGAPKPMEGRPQVRHRNGARPERPEPAERPERPESCKTGSSAARRATGTAAATGKA